MEQDECKKCGKVIEGYNPKHVEFLMMQHELKHRNDFKKEKRKNGN